MADDCPHGDFSDESLGLSDEVLRGVFAYGFERPSAVQRQVLPAIVAGRDVIAQARSGTGKTGAFAIAACEIVHRRRPQADQAAAQAPLVVVLQHTRELVGQTSAVFRAIGAHSGARVAPCVGGVPTAETVAELGAGCDIVVGTPGRVGDCLSRLGALRLDCVRLLVIDEVDEVLRDTTANSFLAVVRDVLACVPRDAQMALLSATMPQQLLDMTSKFMQDPVRLLLAAECLPLEGIQQNYIACDEGSKYGQLAQLFGGGGATQSMIFCASKDRATELCERLRADGVDAAAVHADIQSKARRDTMREFRAGQIRVLVCTELLARGIDVQQVGLVVMYDLCHTADTYLHCVGRCGRFGRQGRAVLLVNDYDLPMVRSIEQVFGITIEPLL